MDRIFIKPFAREIVIKGQTQEGRGDIFSYTYENGDEKRLLGSLYVVGNINGVEKESDDNVSYVTNLVASLAKREYYVDPAAAPRDAFNSCLKKINDVVEEFFKNKDAKINIGIFAIAGEQIFISKIGKFKILLARDKKNIDILNNIELFHKDHVEEKKFSNIISGKICAGDRLFAFYPCRSLVARERSIKTQLIKSDPEKFVEGFHSIKKDKENFGCTALYLDLQEIKEPAVAAAPQPQEMEKSAPEPDLPREIEPQIIPDQMNAVLAAKKSRVVPVVAPTMAEAPKIIPTEFSLGRRKNLLLELFKKIDFGHIYRLSLANQRKKLLFLGFLVGFVALAVALTLTVKSVFIVSEEEKQINQIVKEAETNLKIAQTKVGGNDPAGARSVLVAALANLINLNDKKTAEIHNQLLAELDQVDIAEEASPALVATLPADLGSPLLAAPAALGEEAASAEGIIVFFKNETSGAIAKIVNSAAGAKIEIKQISPDKLFATGNSALLFDSKNKKLTTADISSGNTKTNTFETASPVNDGDVYEGNLYLLSPDAIFKISDAVNGGVQAKTWSQEQIEPAALITVDGEIFTLTEKGLLTVYYKGKKENQFNTNLTVSGADQLLTTKDGPNLYLINKGLGRIYVIKKDSGALAKTVKIGSSQPILNASIAPNGAIYILTSDSKIWKIIP